MVDDQYNLKGLITVKDIQKKLKYPNAAKDNAGPPAGRRGDRRHRRLPGARAGTGPCRADVIVIDTAHGHSERVMEAVREWESALIPTSIWSPATSAPTKAA